MLRAHYSREAAMTRLFADNGRSYATVHRDNSGRLFALVEVEGNQRCRRVSPRLDESILQAAKALMVRYIAVWDPSAQRRWYAELHLFERFGVYRLTESARTVVLPARRWTEGTEPPLGLFDDDPNF